MRLVYALAFALTIASQSPVLAQADKSPPQIESWPLSQISDMGQEIYRQDVAAWVATDAFIAKLGDKPPVGLVGWIVVSNGDDQIVRFVVQTDGVLKSGWDVPVRHGVAGEVVQTANLPLSDVESAMFKARQTALDASNPLRCSRTVNTAVTHVPQGEGWIVWILTPMPDRNVIPMGGHQRLTISQDGSTILRRDLLSAGCMGIGGLTSDNPPAAAYVTSVVSDRPTEAHVFLSLQSRIPIYVSAGKDNLFEVNGARIRSVETSAPPR